MKLESGFLIWSTVKIICLFMLFLLALFQSSGCMYGSTFLPLNPLKIKRVSEKKIDVWYISQTERKGPGGEK